MILEVITILFRDYTETKRVYHVVTLTDLEKTLKNGISFDDKKTYKNKYNNFHKFIDKYRTESIPNWVIRNKAIFSSMNFKHNHIWHSHSAILSIKINEDMCWVCNENIANFLYEPLILQNIKDFEAATKFMIRNGQIIAEDYWINSCSFKDNLEARKDKEEGYDAEILIMHHIPPEDIKVLYIVSDHRYMEVKEWEDFFCSNNIKYSKC